jgi:hypothetical protein
VRIDRVQFELHADSVMWVCVATDLSEATLLEQLRRARHAGPVHIPPNASTTPAAEMILFCRYFPDGLNNAIVGR